MTRRKHLYQLLLVLLAVVARAQDVSEGKFSKGRCDEMGILIRE